MGAMKQFGNKAAGHPALSFFPILKEHDFDESEVSITPTYNDIIRCKVCDKKIGNVDDHFLEIWNRYGNTGKKKLMILRNEELVFLGHCGCEIPKTKIDKLWDELNKNKEDDWLSRLFKRSQNDNKKKEKRSMKEILGGK